MTCILDSLNVLTIKLLYTVNLDSIQYVGVVEDYTLSLVKVAADRGVQLKGTSLRIYISHCYRIDDVQGVRLDVTSKLLAKDFDQVLEVVVKNHYDDFSIMGGCKTDSLAQLQAHI